MYIRQSDLFVSAAILMYIVFFALSPPEFVRTILSNPVGMSASFGVAVYVALYHSKAIGALLIVALLASMTQVTEHLDNPTTTPPSTPTLIPGTAGRTLTDINKEIDDLKKVGLTETSDNEAMKKLIRERSMFQMGQSAQASTPPVDRPQPTSSAPATPPVAAAPPVAAPPKPTMSCNLENFAAY